MTPIDFLASVKDAVKVDGISYQVEAVLSPDSLNPVISRYQVVKNE